MSDYDDAVEALGMEEEKPGTFTAPSLQHFTEILRKGQPKSSSLDETKSPAFAGTTDVSTPFKNLESNAEVNRPQPGKLPGSFAPGMGQQNPKLASASKQQHLYAPPEYVPPAKAEPYLNGAGPDPFDQAIAAAKGTVQTQRFFEPSDEEFVRQHPEAQNLRGTEYASAKQEFADSEWKKAYANAVATNQPVTRVAYAGGSGPWGSAVRGSGELLHSAASGLLGLDKTFLYGAGQKVGTNAGLSTPENLRNVQESAPVSNAIGEIAGALSPAQPLNRALGDVPAALGADAIQGAKGVLARTGVAAAQGAAQGVGQVAGQSVVQGEAPTIQDVGRGAGYGAAAGAALHPFSELLGSRQQKFRENTPDLVNAERSGLGETSVAHGIAPTDEAKGIIEQGHELNRNEPIAKPIGPGVFDNKPYGGRFGEVEQARAGATRGEFFKSPEGQTAHPVTDLMNALREERAKLNLRGTDKIIPGWESAAKQLDNYINGTTDWAGSAESEAVPPNGKSAGGPVPVGEGRGPNWTAKANGAGTAHNPVYEGEFTDSNVGANGKPLRQGSIEGEVVPPPEKLPGRPALPPAKITPEEVIARARRGEATLEPANMAPSGKLPESGFSGIPDRRQSLEFVLRNGGVPDNIIAHMDDEQAQIIVNRMQESARNAREAGRAVPKYAPGYEPGTAADVRPKANGAAKPASPPASQPSRSVAGETPTEPDIGRHETSPGATPPYQAERYNAPNLDKLVKGLDKLQGPAKEKLPGLDKLMEAARKARDQFSGGPGMPQGPGGFSQFENNEAQRIAGKNALFRLGQQARPHFFGTHLNPANQHNILALKLRLDPLYSGLQGAFSRAGGAGAVLANDQEKKNLELQLAPPLGGGLR